MSSDTSSSTASARHASIVEEDAPSPAAVSLNAPPLRESAGDSACVSGCVCESAGARVHVLLLKDEEGSEEYAAALAAVQADVSFVSVLECELAREGDEVISGRSTSSARGDGVQALSAAVSEPDSCLIITSTRAVRACIPVFKPMHSGLGTGIDGSAQDRRRLSCFVVGSKTAAAAAAAGLEVLNPPVSCATELLPFILAHARSRTHPRFVFPCGNRRMDTIPNALASAGIPCDEHVVYSTRPRATEAVAAELLASLQQPCTTSGNRMCVFFSPSGVEACTASAEVATTLRESTVRCIAIGHTTALKMEAASVPVAGICPTPDAAGVVAEVTRIRVQSSPGRS